MSQLTEQQKYQLDELAPEPIQNAKPFYEQEKVETTILMSGTTKLTTNFVRCLSEHFAFKGNERWANAKIFGSVTIYQPNIILDFPSQKFSIEKKVVGDREFWRIWFSPSESNVTTTSLSDIVKAWCGFRFLSLDCNVTQEILSAVG